jgi:hypothetical protein
MQTRSYYFFLLSILLTFPSTQHILNININLLYQFTHIENLPGGNKGANKIAFPVSTSIAP